MDQRKLLRRCAVAVMLVTVIQFLGAGLFRPLLEFLRSKDVISLLVYAQTGRVTPDPPPQTTPATEETEPSNSTFPTQTTQPSQREEPPDAVLSFSAEALSLISVRYSCDYRPDLQALLTQPLFWDLTEDDPTVLIVHTHATESYAGDYKGSERFRSREESLNMIAVGEEVARVLEAGGITVLHDKTLHDYPDYNSSYSAARKTIKQYLKEYPSIQIVLDLHRDASDNYENQLVTAATVGGQRSAQLMMVIGTDAGGNHHPNWQENLALALKLTALLEQENPGICRPTTLRSQRFNMDLTPGSLLVEVGAAGNTLPEALIAANALAQAILELAQGAE